MALNDEIIKLLNEFGKDFITDLQKSLSSKGNTFANSRLHGAIGDAFSSAVFEDGSFKIRFIIPSYYYWVDQDRKSGDVSKEADKRIEEWANSRGYIGKFMDNYPKNNLQQRLKKQAEAKQRNSKRTKWKKLTAPPRPTFAKAKKQFVYLVKRKVARDGYSSKAKGFFSDVYNDGRIQTLTKALSDLLGREIVVEFTRQ